MRMANHVSAQVVMRSVAWLLACWFSMRLASADGADQELFSRVVKLNHLAVILPESETIRGSWGGDCQLWTPVVAEVAAAEKAILRALRQMKQASARVNLDEKYIIQYSGIILGKTRLIECGVYRIESLRRNEYFDDMLITLLTDPYDETDSQDWFDAIYDTSTGRLSDSLGSLHEEPSANAPSARGSRCLTVPEKKAVGIASGGAPDEKSVSRVVKLNHLAVILPELQIVRESWGEGCQLWSPTVQQVAAAEKAVLRRMEDEARAGAKVEPKAKYIIQYHGVVLDGRKLIVCDAWRIEALQNDFGLDELLEILLTGSYSGAVDFNETGPADFIALYYHLSTGQAYDYPEGDPESEDTKRRVRPPQKKPGHGHEERQSKRSN